MTVDGLICAKEQVMKHMDIPVGIKKKFARIGENFKPKGNFWEAKRRNS